MSLAIKYENLEDARMRLRGTVVLYEGSPFYIRDVQRPQTKDDGIFRVVGNPLPLTGRETVDPEGEMRKFISSKNFDIGAFRMGYVNSPSGAFYCSRLPNRQQKQGLSGDTFSGRTNRGNAVPFTTFTSTKEVVNMVKNDYPSFDLAKRSLAKSPAVAFSRDFCLERDEILEDLQHLYHKGSKVGAVLNGNIVLGNKFKCLKESLEELGVKIK